MTTENFFFRSDDYLRELSGEDTHYVIIDSASSSEEERKNSVNEVRSSFELHLVQSFRPIIPIINLFFGGGVADVINLMKKLELGHSVIILSGLGGFCDKVVRFLRNPTSNEFTSDHAAIWQNLAQLQNSEKLHVIDLQVSKDYEKVFSIASKLMSPEKRIKLGEHFLDS